MGVGSISGGLGVGPQTHPKPSNKFVFDACSVFVDAAVCLGPPVVPFYPFLG